MTSNVFILCFYMYFTLLFLSHFFFLYLFWAKFIELEGNVCLLESNRLFSFVYFPLLLVTFFALRSIFANRTGRSGSEPLVKSKPAHFFSKHTHFQTAGCFSFSDACAWNFLHCFLLPCSFTTSHDLHWNYNVVVAQ